mmetsp:Transcript_39445/g.80698  ORF Transcript_39445/g.80698 Transcript_39445/m.80698 type:complete len:366 (+) Transcript_39445:25-1122(+)
MGDALESENCTICYDPILSQPTVALACGHVYHLKCIDSWLGQCTSGSELCPQCKHKTRKGQLRVLQYDVVPCLTAPHEVQRDLAATAEVRQRRLQEAREECRTCREELRSHKSFAANARATGDEVRDQRKSHEERQVELAGLLEDLKATQDEASQKLQEVRSHYDSRMELVFRKLPIDPVGEHDQDYLEEKRKCRHTRPSDRLQSLHPDLTASMALRTKTHERRIARNSAAEGAEKHLMGVHLEVEQLMKAKAAIKATKAKALPKAAEVLDQSLAPSLLELKREVMATAPVKAPKPPKRARSLEQAPKESDDDMADFLGPSKLRRASTSIRLGSLADKAQAPAPRNFQAPPQRMVKSRSLKALFA